MYIYINMQLLPKIKMCILKAQILIQLLSLIYLENIFSLYICNLKRNMKILNIKYILNIK